MSLRHIEFRPRPVISLIESQMMEIQNKTNLLNLLSDVFFVYGYLIEIKNKITSCFLIHKKVKSSHFAGRTLPLVRFENS